VHWSSLAQRDTVCATVVSLFPSQLHQASPHTDVTRARCPRDYELELNGKQSQRGLTVHVLTPHLLASADHHHSNNLQYAQFSTITGHFSGPCLAITPVCMHVSVCSENIF